jgi:hypothetical protein
MKIISTEEFPKIGVLVGVKFEQWARKNILRSQYIPKIVMVQSLI